MRGLRCPECGGENTEVKDSRDGTFYRRRRRVCLGCGERFSTIELPVKTINRLVAEKVKSIVEKGLFK